MRLFFRTRSASVGLLIVMITVVGAVALIAAEWKSGKVWPEPLVVDPGPPGGPPADAIVLFDGKDMSAWKGAEDWEIKDGAVTVKGLSSSNLHYAESKQSFGDCQLHVEWAEPERVTGSGQGRGNSGVYLRAATKYRSSIRTTTNLLRWPVRVDLQANARRW